MSDIVDVLQLGKLPTEAPMLTLLFGAVSLLYATVGQAGGTAFLAVMAFASFPSNESCNPLIRGPRVLLRTRAEGGSHT